MFSTLRRLFNGVRHDSDEGGVGLDLPGPSRVPQRHATADFTEGDDDEETHDEAYMGRDEDGLRQSGHALPVFSSTNLDLLPVYGIVHAIRAIVQTKTETTLSWEQLRSPQISQFLVNPIQGQIRAELYSKATVYALMANCLQFTKEAQLYPGNAGTCRTRAKLCELLAIKLLKDYSTRELIDALSYDFNPLQGTPGSQTPVELRDVATRQRAPPARTSTLEIAVRASAKHFLAHPLVVQQIEAIWSGAISFYSSADALHRKASSARREPRLVRRSSQDPRTPLLGPQPQGAVEPDPHHSMDGRRTVVLYNPRNASLFKLSRLRVPRYRQFLSTCSLMVLIGLFLTVLAQRSSRITVLELAFWFWSAGFMLDELVGFNEHGFSLYIMSFWNVFDLGILALLIAYFGMRIYGVFIVDAHSWNQMAYDVLAANGIMLLPRTLSALDRSSYFSQLLLASRVMIVDLAAVFILLLASCSGFFVFFTLSRAGNDTGEVAFRIFQLFMGYTAPAWEVWPSYDWLGKGLLALFLTICHFVVVTMLIAISTNSFIGIVSSVREEHQFRFAVKTISIVQNNALFSYIAPGNICAWLLMPLRSCLTLGQFVALNRFVIKVTHFPLLFCIFVFERFFLARYVYEATDLVEDPGRGRRQAVSLADPASRVALFGPVARLREDSVVAFRKTRALEEVFRRTPDMATQRTQRRNERRRTQTAIRDWMDRGDEPLSSRNEYPTLERRPSQQWQRRMSMGADRVLGQLRHISEVRSTASDPADLSNLAFPTTPTFLGDSVARRDHAEGKDNTDADGDDELVTNDEDEDDNADNGAERRGARGTGNDDEDYFTTAAATQLRGSPGSAHRGSGSPNVEKTRRSLHSRTLSTNTILYNPPNEPPRSPSSSSSAAPTPQGGARSRPRSARHTPVETPTATTAGYRTPRRSVYLASRPRNILSAKDQTHPTAGRSAPGLAIDTAARRAQRRVSLQAVLDPEDNEVLILNPHDNDDDDDEGMYEVHPRPLPFIPAATGATTPMGLGYASARDGERLNRLLLARMESLEDTFVSIMGEMKALQQSARVPSVGRNSGSEGSWRGARRGGHATVEIAGRERERERFEASSVRRTKTTSSRRSGKRPASWFGLREERAGSRPDSKGKGRAVPQSDADDSDEGGRTSLSKKGSSF